MAKPPEKASQGFESAKMAKKRTGEPWILGPFIACLTTDNARVSATRRASGVRFFQNSEGFPPDTPNPKSRRLRSSIRDGGNISHEIICYRTSPLPPLCRDHLAHFCLRLFHRCQFRILVNQLCLQLGDLRMV